MFDNFKTPSALKKLLELGNAKPTYSDSKKRPYRSSSNRYFWAVAALFMYFLLSAYLIGGGDIGSSDNSGIYKLVFGALIVGGLAAFFAPRLNERLQGMMPEGRRKSERRKKKSSQRISHQERRSSQSRSDVRSDEKHSEQSQTPPVKTDL